MNINDMYPTRYLNSGDLPRPQLFTVKGISRELLDGQLRSRADSVLLATGPDDCKRHGSSPW